jgi:spore coat polysaccharide biosynthesis protein SpsF
MTGTPRIGALIPIRLASERLPGKALKDLCGRPVVHHLLDRVAACRYIDPAMTVVCTTEDPSDDPLVMAVEAWGATVFRGSTDDIIDRFYNAVAHFKFDAVVQVDGDDPLSATEYMNATMERLLEDETVDIVTCAGLPLGTAVKSFRASAMRRVHEHYKTAANDTGFIYFFTKTGLCNHVEIKPQSAEHRFEGARLTLDYEADLEVFRAIFEALYREDEVFGLDAVVEYLAVHPDVVALNQGLDEAYWERTREKAQLEYRGASGETMRIHV